MPPLVHPNPPKMGLYAIRCLTDERVSVGQSRRLDLKMLGKAQKRGGQ